MFSFSCFFFFFQQKTAYEMRISDWSSDVCSSDLITLRFARPGEIRHPNSPGESRGKSVRRLHVIIAHIAVGRCMRNQVDLHVFPRRPSHHEWCHHFTIMHFQPTAIAPAFVHAKQYPCTIYPSPQPAATASATRTHNTNRKTTALGHTPKK